MLQQYVDENRLAGAVALVLRDGQPAYERAVGWSDKEAGRRMAPNTIFRIASQTKAITSAAILVLMEEGKLTLTDPVSRYIPSFAGSKVAVRNDAPGAAPEIVPAKRPITIRDLLTHTAGISYGTDRHVAALYEAKGLGPAAGFGWFTADKDEPICDTMERLGTLPFVAQPGEAWVYGYNTDILGCVVERASGTALDAFVRSRITGPLGMKDTQFFLPPDQRDRLAAVYTIGADGKIARAADGPRGQGAYVEGPRRSFAGGAGLLSTARDYARFLEMIRKGGALDGVRILAPRTVALMTTNQIGTLHSPNRARIRARVPDDRPLRRERAGFGGRVRVVRRIRHDLPRRSRGAAGPGPHGPGAAEHDRHRPEVPDARLSGADGIRETVGIRDQGLGIRDQEVVALRPKIKPPDLLTSCSDLALPALASALAHGLVVLRLAVTAAAWLLAAVVHLVDRGPGSALCLFL